MSEETREIYIFVLKHKWQVEYKNEIFGLKCLNLYYKYDKVFGWKHT